MSEQNFHLTDLLREICHQHEFTILHTKKVGQFVKINKKNKSNVATSNHLSNNHMDDKFDLTKPEKKIKKTRSRSRIVYM